jgi:hypothetical protein
VRRIERLMLACAVLAAAACGPPAEPHVALLAALEEAAEDRDAEAFGQHLGADFSAQGPTNRADTLSMLRRYFAGYEHVAIEVYDVQLAAEGDLVSFVAEFSGRPRQIGGLSGFLPPGAVYRFELELSEAEPGVLLVSGASWEALALPGEEPD